MSSFGKFEFYISKIEIQQSKVGQVVFFIVLANMLMLTIGGYVISKYWLKVSIQSTICLVTYDDFGSTCTNLTRLF